MLLLSLILITYCAGIKNNINRASVSEGEGFVKYGVEGFPEGVEVYKGRECPLTDAEIKSRDKKLERQKRKMLKEYEEQEKYDELRRIAEEFSNSYVDSLTINDTIN